MKRLAAPMTLNNIDSFFSLTDKVDIKTLPGSALAGIKSHPEAGQTSIPNVDRQPSTSRRRFDQQRDPSQHEYAKYYQMLEEESLKKNLPQDPDLDDSKTVSDDLNTVSMSMDLETEKTLYLPAGMTEKKANMVYVNYNFSVQYDENLAIYNSRQEVINTIESNQVTVIQGETGCGKTTQVGQYILDHYARMNKYCNIVITQPRRIAAMSIARHVCQKRNWTLGQICGYQVGLEKETSEDTRLLYCTTGVLLQKLIAQKHMNNYTHIILDEVHERDQEMDFTLLVVKKLQRTNSKHVKVILMSATFETGRFAKYFGIPIHGELQPAPILDIKGRVYAVKQFYLESLHSLGELPILDINEPKIEPQMYEIVKRLIQQFDNIEIQKYGSREAASGFSMKRGSVLIFLPGLGEINEMDEKLQEIKSTYNLQLLALHSSVTREEQVRVFQRPEVGIRKVIMATNIAESSITVPDIKYVIDFCLTKVLMCNPETCYTSLQLQWSSKANCIQRRGRAGRVSDGRAYHLVTKDFFLQLPKFNRPEMLRCPLDLIVLKVKKLDLGEPKAILSLALDPPALNDIEANVLKLKEIGALKSLPMDQFNPCDGQLTFLGNVIAELPLDIKLGKLILLGHVFGLLEACIIISASLSLKSFFSTPFRSPLEAYRKKFNWANNSFSDCLAYLFAYTTWKNHAESGRFPSLNEELRWSKNNYIQLHRIRDVEKLVDELKYRLKKFNIFIPKGPNIHPPDVFSQENQLILKVVLCGAFYPNYFVLEHISEEVAVKELSGHNPCATVMVRGLPVNHGFIYRKNIEDIFSKCDDKKPKVHFEQTKAFIEFQRDPMDKSTHRIHPAVYAALKMRNLSSKGIKMEFPELDPKAAKAEIDRMLELQNTKTLGQSLMLERLPFVGHPDEGCASDVLQQEALPPPGISMVELIPTVIVSCGVFWANYADENTICKLAELQQSINLAAGQNLQMLPPQQLQIGSYCLAPYTDVDGSCSYYRARIEKLNHAEQKAEVFFVDYGNVDSLYYFSLKELEPHFRCLPFQAIECHIYGIKPSPIKCPNDQWTVQANKFFQDLMQKAVRCYGKIYSVVHGILRLDVLLEGEDGSVINVKEKLLSLCYADKTEEDFLSKQNHKERKEAKISSHMTPAKSKTLHASSLQMTSDLASVSLQTTQSKHRRQIHLIGPSHPYEIKFYSMIHLGENFTCRVDMDSVNCVALDSEAHIKYNRLMVAAFVGLNPSGNVMQTQNTTLMPHIPGLPALISLLFAPHAELRISPDKKRFTGVLCGLGWDPVNKMPALTDHDIEITFDTEFDTEDLIMVNEVRLAINLAIGSMDSVAGWSRDSVMSIQKHVRRKLLKLFQKRREQVEPVYFYNPYHWNQVDEDDIRHPDVDHLEFLCTLYELHCAVSLLDSEEQ